MDPDDEPFFNVGGTNNQQWTFQFFPHDTPRIVEVKMAAEGDHWIMVKMPYAEYRKLQDQAAAEGKHRWGKRNDRAEDRERREREWDRNNPNQPRWDNIRGEFHFEGVTFTAEWLHDQVRRNQGRSSSRYDHGPQWTGPDPGTREFYNMFRDSGFRDPHEEREKAEQERRERARKAERDAYNRDREEKARRERTRQAQDERIKNSHDPFFGKSWVEKQKVARELLARMAGVSPLGLTDRQLVMRARRKMHPDMQGGSHEEYIKIDNYASYLA